MQGDDGQVRLGSLSAVGRIEGDLWFMGFLICTARDEHMGSD